jgi:annexin A7/11
MNHFKMASIIPSSDFNDEAVATALRKAMKGLGTDEAAIIKQLSSIDSNQRQAVKMKYKTMYGRDLIHDLKSELGGNFENVTLAMMMTKTEYDAYCLRHAMKGAGTDERALIEVLATRSNEEINAAKAAYHEMFGRDLEKDVMSETSGHLKRILVSLAQGNRDESTDVDQGKAAADAQALKDAGEGQWGTDESEFNRVFMTSSAEQLKAVFAAYREISSYDIRRVIEKEMSGDLEFAFVTLVEAVRDPQMYFAERLYKSMKGMGTDDSTLIRVVVSRSERDMEVIKSKFIEKYSKSLAKMIKGDCSGDYKKMLFGLINDSA